jgi:hypothetical protein
MTVAKGSTVMITDIHAQMEKCPNSTKIRAFLIFSGLTILSQRLIGA